MTTMYLATGDALAVLRRRNGRWRADLGLVDRPTQCLTADPHRPQTVYCGTFGQGLWRSEDAGMSWQAIGERLPHREVTAVAVSPLHENVVWLGTEPSALFRSMDGGATWEELPALRDLPSAPTWSFPPRPWTSHVRWIAPDPIEEQRLFVGIELGGVMRTLDGGHTWEDRKPGSQFDAHTLRTHRLAPDRVYEAAGGGYAESLDGGATWRGFDRGLSRRYVWGLAVDPGDPDRVVVSAAGGPRQAHQPDGGESAIYRREGTGAWREVSDGLPAAKGTRAYVLATNDAEPSAVYASTREGALYRSPDAGATWEQLEVIWPEGYRVPDVRGLTIVDDG